MARYYSDTEDARVQQLSVRALQERLAAEGQRQAIQRDAEFRENALRDEAKAEMEQHRKLRAERDREAAEQEREYERNLAAAAASAASSYSYDDYNNSSRSDANDRLADELSERRRQESEARRANERAEADAERRRRADEAAQARQEAERRREELERQRREGERARQEAERNRQNRNSGSDSRQSGNSRTNTPAPRDNDHYDSRSSNYNTNTPAPTNSTPPIERERERTPAPTGSGSRSSSSSSNRTPARVENEYTIRHNDAERDRSQRFDKEAEAYRKRVDHQAKEEQRHRNSGGRGGLESITKPASSLIKREIRSTITHDTIGREGRDSYLLGSTVANVTIGAAMLVASCAAEAAYSSAIMRAQKDAADNNKQQFKELYKAAEEGYKTTLAEYSKNVETQRERVESTRKDSFAEFSAAKESAQKKIDEIHERYNKDISRVDRDIAREDKKMMRELNRLGDTSAAKEALEAGKLAATKNRDSAVSGANESYEREITRIKSEVPAGKDRTDAMQRAAEKRDSSIRNAETVFKTEVTRHEEKFKSHAKQTDAIVQEHNSKIENLQKTKAHLENKMSKEVDPHIKTVAKAQEEFTKSVRLAKSGLSNAETRLSSFEQSADSQKFIRTAQQGANKFSQKNDTIPLTFGASNFAQIVSANHRNVGSEMAANFASPAEKAILDKVAKDKAAAAQAARDGVPHVKIATDADYQAAKQIKAKYAGNIKTEEGVKQTVANLNKATKILDKDCKSLGESIKGLNKELSGLDGDIKSLRGQIAQVAADKQALKLGKDANGNILNEAQKTALKAKIDSANIGEMKSKLAGLNQQQLAAKKALDTANNKLADKTRSLNVIKQHANFLSKDGKAIADCITAAETYKTLNVFTKRGRDNIKAIGEQRALIKEQRAQKLITRREAKQQLKQITVKGQLKDNAKLKLSAKAGRSKKAERMAKGGQKRIMSSVQKIKKEFDKKVHKGNVLHDELFGNMRKSMMIAQKYELAVNVTSKVLFFLPGVASKAGGKLIGHSMKFFGLSNTNLGKKLTAMNARMLRGKALVSKGVGKLVMAPAAILKAPMELRNIPMKLAGAAIKGTFRVGRNLAGATLGRGARVVGGAARLGGKAVKGTARLAGRGIKAGWNKTIGKTKWYKRKVARAQALKQRFKEFRKKIGDKINPIGRFFKKIGSKLWGLIASVVSFIFTCISYVISGIAAILGAALGFILTVAVLVLLVSLLMSVLAAIWEFFKSLTADYQSYIKHDPEFIMNNAINYRNEELEILELFDDAYEAAYDPSSDGSNAIIEACDQPIFYALYDDSWDWWGLVDTTVDLVGVNSQSKSQYIALVTAHGLEYDAWKNAFVKNDFYCKDDFTYQVATYRTARIRYYMYDQLTKDASGKWIPNTSKASDYEISNARDALAAVDALYTNKPDMQKVEALAYIGVGDYQVATGDTPGTNGSSSNGRNKSNKNLFWATHEFVYLNGTEDDDVWFHVTNNYYGEPVQDADGRWHVKYTLNVAKMYANGSQAAAPKNKHNSYSCEWNDTYSFEGAETITTEYALFDSYSTSWYAVCGKTTTQAQNIQKMWDTLYAAIPNAYAVAGIMGNIAAESSFYTNNVEGLFEAPLGVNDTTYTNLINGLLDAGKSATATYKTITVGEYTTTNASSTLKMTIGRKVKTNNVYGDLILSNEDTYMAFYPYDDTQAERNNRVSGATKKSDMPDTAEGDYIVYADYGNSRWYYVYTYVPASEELEITHSSYTMDDVDNSKEGRFYRDGDYLKVDMSFTTDQRRTNGNWDDDLGAGYGICQWSSSGRKQNLYNFAKNQGKDIDDIEMQTAFLLSELEDYSWYEDFCAVKSVEEATEIIIREFEKPSLKKSDGTYYANYREKSDKERLPASAAVFNYFVDKYDLQYTREENCIIEYQTCRGHADLDVAMVVTTLSQEDGTEDFFEACKTVEGLPDGAKADHFLWIFTWDSANDTIGLGTVDYNPFNPSEDWKNDDYKEAARVKALNDVEYIANKDDAADGADELTHDSLKSDTVEDFDAFKVGTMADGKKILLMQYAFDKKTFASPWFVSGEQKNIPRWDSTAQTYLEKYLSFTINKTNGKIEHTTDKQY